MKKKLLPVLAAAAAAFFAAGAALAQSATAEGVLRKVDAANGRVIIKHGEFRGYAMSAMTMAFNVADRAQLEGLKVQDEVRFQARLEGRDWLITDIKPLSRVQAAAGEPDHPHTHGARR